MSLESKAQELYIIEEPMEEGNQVVLEPLMVNDNSLLEVMESDEPNNMVHPHGHAPLSDIIKDIADDVGSDDFVIVIDDIPGAPKGTENPEIEVVEDDENKEKDKESDENKLDLLTTPKGKWDWTYKNPEDFMKWVHDRINEVPNHSGYDTSGIDRAIAYLERIDVEISKAMRADIDGLLDADLIENARAQIDNGIDKLNDRKEAIKKSKKKQKKKADIEYPLNKEAQKITGVGGVMVTVPLLISSLARVCINSVVSAGKDLEDVFNKQCDKYDLNDREKVELRQLLTDMGFPLHYDRGHDTDETYSVSSEDNFDWNQNFPG